MKKDNTKVETTPIIHTYKPTKVNKASIIYNIDYTRYLRNPNCDDFFTNLIKIEKDQGYSKANAKYWLRIRNQSNWSKCQTPTGLFKTIRQNVFRGDILSNKVKSLILFYFDEEYNELRIFKYQRGYNPSRKIIDQIIKSL